MRVQLDIATPRDVAPLIALRTAVARAVTAQHGEGPWSRTSTERGVLYDMRISRVFVARSGGHLIATLRLATRKPWAIDLKYFHPCRQPIYLQSMAVKPELWRQGIGRQCVGEAITISREWPADALRLDAYDGAAGAGPFYQKCGFTALGRKVYRDCPLAYFEKLL